jgi:hypothetical protein
MTDIRPLYSAVLWPKRHARRQQAYTDGYYGRESVRMTHDSDRLDREWQRGQMFRLSGVFLTDNAAERVIYEPARTILQPAPRMLRPDVRPPLEVVYKKTRRR